VRDVDVVIDTVGGDTLARSWQVLRPDGVRSVYFVVAPHREQLTEIARLVDAGALRPMPGPVFPLADTATAVTIQRDQHIRGKVVIQVRPEGAAAVG
jgi:NADPH:quinone reductase-like Zn-dependent oxidoreductase